MQAILPSVSVPSDLDVNAYQGLDEPVEWLAFSELVTQNAVDARQRIWESRIVIEGMHCAACGFAVEKALKSIEGVLRVEVSASAGRARVVWNEATARPSVWMQAITLAGYAVFPQANTDFYRRKQHRLLMWRWLVAGFCMMQVMMYAYPTYVASVGDVTPDMAQLLRWASFVLTLPVMFFSSGPFFQSAISDLKHRRISMDLPVAIGIAMTFAVSTAATWHAIGAPEAGLAQPVYFDSLTMFVFFLLTGRWLEARLRDRTAGALEKLMHRLPTMVDVQQDNGEFVRVHASRLRVHDVVRVLPGEAFPADGQVVEGATSVDEALLTGESRAVNKSLGDAVVAGSHNLTEPVLFRVDKVGTQTQYAQMVSLMERVSVDKPRLALLADRIAKPFLWGVLFAALGAACWLWSVDHVRALMAAVAVLVVTCPCALSLATPAAMLTSAGVLARKGVLVRRLQALEALTKIDTIFFDKTGTLTQSNIQVSAIQPYQGLSEAQALQLAASIAQRSLHPISRALVATHVDRMGAQQFVAVKQVKEISGLGLVASTEFGEVRLGSAKHCQHTQLNDDMQIFMSNAKGLLATFTLVEALRDDARATLHTLRAQGYSLAMVTGDRSVTAHQVAHPLAINEVLADCTPQQKLTYMQQRQAQGHHVLMVGDGLNDGPVLAGADVSIAMGHAVPIAQAKCDVVVLGAQLAMLPLLLKQAHHTLNIIKQNLYWAAGYNAICVPLAVLGYLPAWLAGLGMATSSLLVVTNAARLTRTVGAH